jgi:hypothetical protein
MQDTIILGNGTSKQIKTVSLPNSYAEFKAMAENGNLFADIKLNADGCEVVGTPLNKLNLLTDETSMELDNAENVDKALAFLAESINGIIRGVIQRGSASGDNANNSITFENPFKIVPTVMAIAKNLTNNTNHTVMLKGITESGFVWRPSTNGVTIVWIAYSEE